MQNQRIPILTKENFTYHDTDYLLSLDTLKNKYFELNRYNPIDDVLFDITLQSSLSKIKDKIWHAHDVIYHSPDNMETGNIILSTIPNVINGTISAQEECVRLIRSIEEMTGKPLGVVISCVSPHEIFNNAGIITPIDWTLNGVKNYHLPMVDFQASATVDQMLHAAFVAIKAYDEGKNVLIHCKAGKSRSLSLAIVIIAILELRSEGKKYQLSAEIYELVLQIKKHRPQIDIGREKINVVLSALQCYYASNNDFSHVFAKKYPFPNEWRSMEEQDNEKESNLSKRFLFDQLLCSLELKNAIVQSPAFIAMAGYITKFFKAERTHYLKNFLTTILNATSDDWYAKIVLDNLPKNAIHIQNYFPQSELTQFLYCQPEVRWDDKAEREELVNLFKCNLQDLIVAIMGLSIEESESLNAAYQDGLLFEIEVLKQIKADTQIVDEVKQLPSYLALKAYYNQQKGNESILFKSKRAQLLGLFMLEMGKTDATECLFNILTDNEPHINKFFQAKPERTNNDEALRKHLITNFKLEIKTLLLSRLNNNEMLLNKIIDRNRHLKKSEELLVKTPLNLIEDIQKRHKI